MQAITRMAWIVLRCKVTPCGITKDPCCDEHGRGVGNNGVADKKCCLDQCIYTDDNAILSD